MDYKVVVIANAKADLRRYIAYLVNVKKSNQAAKNVLDDFRETRKSLETIAGSLKLCDNEKLAQRGLHRINFHRHNYFMLYYLEGKTAFVTNIFHESEDYENKLV